MVGNTFGRVFRVTTCGESYGKGLMTIVDGVPPGLPLAEKDIQPDLDRRRPGTSAVDSPRKETDQVEIIAGTMDGLTTGAPVGLLIRNVDTQKVHVDQYRDYKDLIRPGHAEYTYFVKYDTYSDWRGAGRASGRETAGRVAGGGVARKILKGHGIEVAGFVKECIGIEARDDISWEEIYENRNKNIIRCPDLEAADKMISKALKVREQGDTVGGVVELRSKGVPAGLGEPVFDKLDGAIAGAIMSIGATKGVEIGKGFEAARMLGSEFNDHPYLDEEDRVRWKTNNAGGVLGGISNGDEIIIKIAVKPTPTVSVEQPSIDMEQMKETILSPITRRDVTICARIVVVAEAMLCMVLVDHMMMWRGYDALSHVEHKWR